MAQILLETPRKIETSGGDSTIIVPPSGEQSSSAEGPSRSVEVGLMLFDLITRTDTDSQNDLAFANVLRHSYDDGELQAFGSIALKRPDTYL